MLEVKTWSTVKAKLTPVCISALYWAVLGSFPCPDIVYYAIFVVSLDQLRKVLVSASKQAVAASFSLSSNLFLMSADLNLGNMLREFIRIHKTFMSEWYLA